MTTSRQPFVQTGTILDKILSRKVEEIAERKDRVTIDDAVAVARDIGDSARRPRALIQILRDRAADGEIALIAEAKKASPSKGILIEDFDPVKIGKLYAENGAAAISVLTDEDFFQGSLEYLTAVRDALPLPVLRKDFIIDPLQVYDARVAGADAVLLIVATLEDAQMADLHALITELGMAALVEVHDEGEMERALKLGAPLIGINNRDLRTFDIDLETTARLASLVPEDVILVAESGIASGEDVRRMGELGAHAVLVGEALVKAPDMAAAVREFSSQGRT
jgi:indole-3-glycerol phosphate synthase